MPAASVPIGTFPTVASVSPCSFRIEIAAPAATRPRPTPIASVYSSRSARAETVMPPPARGSFAPVSTCAFCRLVSLRTTTWPPTATTPPVPPKAMAKTSEVCLASTDSEPPAPPPADTTAFGPMPASAIVSTLRTRTAAPTPTKPTATLPAIPNSSRSSFARTFTAPPATTVPLIAAEVPSGSGCGPSAVPVGEVGALAEIFPVALFGPELRYWRDARARHRGAAGRARCTGSTR